MGRPFVSAGVVRIGLAGVGDPVVPAPDLFRRKLRLRITTAVEGWGCKGELAYFYSRAFRFATRCRVI